MKFKKPSEKTLSNSAATFGGVVVGSFLSNGVFDAIHKPSGSQDEASLKKEKTKALLIRGGMAAAGFVGASAIEGSDLVSLLAKGVCVGVASAQALEAAKTLMADTKAVTGNTAVKKFVRSGLGLGCPCNEGLNGARRRRQSRLRAADTVPFEYVASPTLDAVPLATNALESAMQTGRLAS